MNEFDSRSPGSGGAPDWRQKLDSQRGAVMASEIKNNSNKLSKWAVESILSGSDLIKIGFVGRVIPKDKNRHQILGISQFKPREFAGQINLDLGNCWGIVRAIVDLVLKQEDGKYLLFKDPNKACLKLFAVGDDLEAIEEEDDV